MLMLYCYYYSNPLSGCPWLERLQQRNELSCFVLFLARPSPQSSTPYWTLVPTYLDTHWTQEKALGLVACSVVPKTMG
jgi:hypothetical protein